LDALNGKRIAVAGFEPEAAARLTEVLEQALAFSRVLSLEAVAPGSAMLENLDLVVAPVAGGALWFRLRRRSSEKPILLIGTVKEIEVHIARLRAPSTDFLLAGWTPEELWLRASALLMESGGRPTRKKRPPLVVAVDDEPSITALVRSMMLSEGFTCETGSNGAEALELVRRLNPDVLVLDINMPHLDGFEVLTAMKLDPATASVRVILLTGAEQESDIMRGFALGAADYVVKPFNPMELLVRVRRFVRWM
jgi:DNA-binding response OmpR family regulator